MWRHLTSATLRVEGAVVECDTNKWEAIVASLSLSLCNDGRLACDYNSICIDTLKETLENAFPEWEPLDSTIDCIRWIDDKLQELTQQINQEFVDDEDLCV